MGLAKRFWMEQLELEEEERKLSWIREQLDDPDADEHHPGWQDLAAEYEWTQNDGRFQYEEGWEVTGKSRLEIFQENIDASTEILKLNPSPSAKRNLLVMLHGHTVASVEAYLSATFIEVTLTSDDLMRRLVETDPEFAKQKFTIQEIFTKRDSLKDDLRKYLKALIFHDIAKIEKMYKSVLDTDFGDVLWLYKAVGLRHDCVHRAGYDKEGNAAPVSEESVGKVIKQCHELVHSVEKSVLQLPAAQTNFF